MPIHAAVSFNYDPGLIQACLPLFEAAEVDALEWSFDTLSENAPREDWFDGLLSEFGEESRLIGHGVYFSLFSGKWRKEQQIWLEELKRLSQRFRFHHVTEHFGFLTGTDFHKGAPLAVPHSQQTLAIGRDRLMRIADACGCPVGLENLAFAPSLEAAKRHGEFLEQLLAPVNGFLLLDLHNFHCHASNFDLDAQAVLATYPLERVRELHLSGGSWEPSDHRPSGKIRRDTHDHQVPEEVFQLLEKVIPQCPHLGFVVLEQMGFTLADAFAQQAFQEDFRRMRAIAQAQPESAISHRSFLPTIPKQLGAPLQDENLHRLQTLLSEILEQSESLEEARAAISASALAGTGWEQDYADPAMLETARQIARKWKDGFSASPAW